MAPVPEIKPPEVVGPVFFKDISPTPSTPKEKMIASVSVQAETGHWREALETVRGTEPVDGLGAVIEQIGVNYDDAIGKEGEKKRKGEEIIRFEKGESFTTECVKASFPE